MPAKDSEVIEGFVNSQEGSTPAARVPDAADLLHREFRQNLGEITRQSAIFFAGTIFTLAAGYFVKIYVARVLGAELLGIYALGMTLVSFTQLFGLVGLPGTVARYIAVYNATGKIDQLRALLSRSTAFVVLLNLLLAVVIFGAGRWIAQHLYRTPELARYIPGFALLMFLGALSVFYAQVMAGFKDVAKRTIITNFVGSPLVMVLTIVLLAMGTRLWGYIAAQIAGTIMIVLLLAVSAWKLTPRASQPPFGSSVPLDREIYSFSAASFGMSSIDFLSTQADKILIGIYLAARPVGIYVLASTLAAFVPMILQSVNQIFAPVIADLHAQGRREVLQRLFQTITKWVLALTLPLALLVIVFARPLMRLFGTDFEAGWPVLVIIAIGQIVNCAVGSVGYLLLMSGNQRRLIKVQFAMAVISLLVNLALIPTLGIKGAALAAAIVLIGSNLWNLREVRDALQLSPYNRGYYGLLLPTALVIATLYLLRVVTVSVSPQWIVILPALILSYAVFGGTAFAFGLDSDDRLIARDAWQQLRRGLQKLGMRP